MYKELELNFQIVTLTHGGLKQQLKWVGHFSAFDRNKIVEK